MVRDSISSSSRPSRGCLRGDDREEEDGLCHRHGFGSDVKAGVRRHARSLCAPPRQPVVRLHAPRVPTFLFERVSGLVCPSASCSRCACSSAPRAIVCNRAVPLSSIPCSGAQDVHANRSTSRAHSWMRLRLRPWDPCWELTRPRHWDRSGRVVSALLSVNLNVREEAQNREWD